MKKYTLVLLAAVAAFLSRNAVAGDELVRVNVQPQPKPVVVTSPSTDSSDCGCSTPKPLVHFKDGIPSNGPVTGEPSQADPAYYADAFGFRDYGPAHVVIPPPAPMPVKKPAS